jgi:hypothetical protein
LGNDTVKMQWIIKYISENTSADVCNQDFHDRFHVRFGGKRKFKMWGAMPVLDAQRLLKRMYEMGMLKRCPIGFGTNWQPGYPRWVYSYCLPI